MAVHDAVDVVTLIEVAASAVGATTGIFALAWKPVVKRHDERVADDLLLHGREAKPGIPAISPAGDRLATLEVGMSEANTKLDDHGEILTSLSDNVSAIAAEFNKDHGTTMRDKLDLMADEQVRVADQAAKPNKRARDP